MKVQKYILMFVAILTMVAVLSISGCKKKETYIVTFDANGGTGEMKEQIFTEGEPRALAGYLFAYKGHIFDGWNTMPNGSGTSYDDRQSILVTSDMTLYAQWKRKIKPVTVTFDANGGSGEMAPQIFIVGDEEALALNTFTYDMDGYVFACWNTTPDGSGTSYRDGQIVTITSDMTLYAQWALGYRVTFNANGGSGSMPPQTFLVGETNALYANSFTWQNHQFVSWNTEQEGTGVSYSDMQEISLGENITLFAQWRTLIDTQEGLYYVDLGLPSGIMWSYTNVGATNPEDFGKYFAWGETTTKTNYSWGTYKYCRVIGDSQKLTKYCYSSSYGYNGYSDDLTTLELCDDAAATNWDRGWQMPTKEEFQELIDNCVIESTTLNGVSGMLYTGPNGNSIFLPNAGYCNESGFNHHATGGYYWSSSLVTSGADPYSAWYLSNTGLLMDTRDFGCSVRPVIRYSK